MTPKAILNIYRRAALMGLLALTLATPLAVVPAPPAHAFIKGFIERFFPSGSGSNPSHRNGAGALRDRACLPGSNTELQDIAQIFALVPTTAIARTTRATPEIFFHVPVQRNESDQPTLPRTERFLLRFQLTRKVPESPINPGISDQDPAASAQGSSQVVFSQSFELPTDSRLVRVQIPEETPLAIDSQYEWSLRLLCERQQPSPSLTANRQSTCTVPSASLSTSTLNRVPGEGSLESRNLCIGPLQSIQPAAPPEQTVHQEIYGQIQRIDVPTPLRTALQRAAATRHTVYFENDIWFDGISDLATRPADWGSFLTQLTAADRPSDNDFFNFMTSLDLTEAELSSRPPQLVPLALEN